MCHAFFFDWQKSSGPTTTSQLLTGYNPALINKKKLFIKWMANFALFLIENVIMQK